MEIALLPKEAVKIKGKTASFILNSSENPKDYSAALFLTTDLKRDTMYDQGINIDRPGEYEVGGVKISGTRYGNHIVYTLQVDGVSVLVGSLSAMEKYHGKMQENDLVLIHADAQIDPAFSSSLATNGVLYFGEHAGALESNYLKDDVSKMTKFTSTKDKLPQEMVTILLQ